MVKKKRGKCIVPGCGKVDYLARGMYKKHYGRWLRHGTTELQGRPDFDVVERQATANAVVLQSYCRTCSREYAKERRLARLGV